MMLANGHRAGKPFIMLGLSHENLRLLKEGKPIIKDISHVAHAPLDLVILSGKDEQAIYDELNRQGVLEGAKVQHDPSLDVATEHQYPKET